MSNNLNLYLKIAAVRRGITGLGKSGENSFHRYKYSSDADYCEAIRPVLIEVGLLILPSTKSVNTIEQVDEKGRKGWLTTVEIEYLVIDPDSGEGVALAGYGSGSDPQDKGLYKAYTGCFKYFLKQLFFLAGDEDAENDRAEHGKTAPHAPQSAQPRQGHTPQQNNASRGNSGGYTSNQGAPKVQPSKQGTLNGLQAEKWGFKIPFSKTDARLQFLWNKARAMGMDYTSKKNGGDGIIWLNENFPEAKDYLVASPRTNSGGQPAMDPETPHASEYHAPFINEDGSEDDIQF